MNLDLLFQYIAAGLTYGFIYAIVAIGFNIIYNTTGIINFAQGEFVMLGSMIAISLNPYMPLFFAILLAVLITMLAGAIMEIVFFRWIESPTVLRMIIITIGLSILIREVGLAIWGENVRALPYFTGNEVSSVSILGAKVSPQVLWVIGVCSVTVLGLQVFFKFTRYGWQMRACAVNRDAARLCGIKAKNMVTLSFMLSAGIGALAGCVVSPITYSQYNMGVPLAIKGFTVAILGGLGNYLAAVAGGIVLGIVESFSVWILPSAYKDSIAISILLLILFFRPGGLFGKKEELALKDF